MTSYIKTDIKKESLKTLLYYLDVSKKIKILKSWTSQSFREVEDVLSRPN